MQILLWLAMIGGTFGLILVGYALFGRIGLYAFAALALVIANIQVLKNVSMFGMSATLGNVVFSATFLITDILSEVYDKARAKTAVYIGFFAMVVFLLTTQLALWFPPASDDWAQPHLEALFSILPRLTIASLVAYLVSNLHDVWLYELLKRRFAAPSLLWLRNNLSTLLSQLLDTLLFSFIAFLGVFPLATVLEIALTTYLLKIMISLADTPFLYIARWLAATKKTGLWLAHNEEC